MVYLEYADIVLLLSDMSKLPGTPSTADDTTFNGPCDI